jgi:CTP synthase
MRLGGHDIALRPGTLAASLYRDAPTCRQRFRHRYELVAEYVGALEGGGMAFSGAATDGSLTKQILEIPGHPFFLATQGHPELSSRPARPEPMFRGFLEAAAGAAGRRRQTQEG